MEESSSTATAIRQFSAFLSYSHADAAAVGKLHSKLEAYRLPKELGAISASNSKSGGLGNVFRDREDLSAAQSLSDAVVEALGQSEVLVVVCSPDAKASRWVDQEILLFRQLRPGQPILAAVVRGEPEEAFPAALTEGGNEPLAADLRKEGDGWKLGFLKVVAGIAGVPLDTLIQRDSQRHMRRVMAVTGVAMAAALVMAIMTTVAIQSRNEAQAQRAEAEGLVEYMLTDLRGELKGVGRLDVMTNVNDRAMQYYGNQGRLADLPAESLDRRARIIEAMAEDDENLGEFDRAQAKYDELHRITASLLADDPSNLERVFSHASSENRLAVLANSKGDLDAALVHLRNAWGMIETHMPAYTNDPKWVRMGAYLNGNLCAAYLMKEVETPTAIDHCQYAIDRSRELIAQSPDDYSLRYDLVFHLSWLSDGFLAIEDDQAELQTRRSYLAELEEMVAGQPNNYLWQEQKMEMLTRHATFLERTGKRQQALASLREALSINAVLIRRDAKNEFWAGFKETIQQRIRKVMSNAK